MGKRQLGGKLWSGLYACPSHHSVETNREIAEARGKPERGCDVNGFPLSERHPWFQNDGAGLKKSSGGGGKFPHVY